jgi:hypothetical protein
VFVTLSLKMETPKPDTAQGTFRFRDQLEQERFAHFQALRLERPSSQIVPPSPEATRLAHARLARLP